MENKEKFTWLPFFNEVFHVICEKYNKNTLVNLRNEIFDDKKKPLFEFDPLSFIAELNIRREDPKRINYCNKVKEILSLTSEIPADFTGIPTFNNQNAWFFGKKREDIDDFNILWKFSLEFHKTLTISESLFNCVLDVPEVAIKKLSQFIFIIFPQKYYPMDSKTLSLFPNFQEKDTFESFQNFQNMVREVENFKNMKPYELSAYAYNSNMDNNLQKQYWILSAGDKSSMWEDFKNNNLIAIGWDYELGSLNNYKDKKEIKEKIKESINTKKDKKNDSLALWQFCHDININDIVYIKGNREQIIGKCEINSEYIYDENREKYKHIRLVKWLKIGDWNIKKNTAIKALTNITNNKDFIKEIENSLENNNEIEMKEDIEILDTNYWFLNANPKIWQFSDINIGEIQYYSLYNKNNNPRRIFKNFLNAKAGDIIIGYESTPVKKIVALAKVTKKDDKNLYFEKTEDLINPIEYSTIKDSKELENMEFLKNAQGSLFKLTQEEYIFLMDLIKEDNPIITTNNTVIEYTDKDFLKKVYLSQKQYKELTTILETKNNLVIQGVPGVGKTFSANRLAYSIMKKTDDSHIECIQFHQNYSYEDFIMGYKPNENGFKLEYGIFYEFCKLARNNPKEKYFFIIDEINRGNLSKIFGELLMLIEKDYRDKKIKLSYDKQYFSVPKNLYIIGLMNTADRSLAMIDYALRRRFSFFTLEPAFDSEGFKKYQEGLSNNLFNKLIECIKEINIIISEDNSLGKEFCIGHSYFCNYNNEDNKCTKEKLKLTVDYEIKPMLKEYWFDNDSNYTKCCEKLDEVFSND